MLALAKNVRRQVRNIRRPLLFISWQLNFSTDQRVELKNRNNRSNSQGNSTEFKFCICVSFNEFVSHNTVEHLFMEHPRV